QDHEAAVARDVEDLAERADGLADEPVELARAQGRGAPAREPASSSPRRHARRLPCPPALLPEVTMQQPEDVRDVLFLCRDNAALSPMAASLLDHWARRRFRAWSGGWHPAPGMHALAARTLRRAELACPALKP